MALEGDGGALTVKEIADRTGPPKTAVRSPASEGFGSGVEAGMLEQDMVAAEVREGTPDGGTWKPTTHRPRRGLREETRLPAPP